MTERRYIFGVTFSIAWILLVGYLLFRDPTGVSKMSPNDWGSFLSGAFAPLGFLWLILGYLQQGEELRLSTQALRLQAEELKNSVEQQRALVEVSRLQVEGEREALAEERRLRIEEAKPNLSVYSFGGAFRGDGNSSYPIHFSNSGNIACRLRIVLRLKLGKIKLLLSTPAFGRGEMHYADVEVSNPIHIDGSMVEIRYADQLGNEYLEKYLVLRQTDDHLSGLKFSRIEA
jgi:hypothetical protein